MSHSKNLDNRQQIIEQLKHLKKPDDCLEFIYNYRNALIEALRRMD